MLTGIPEWEKLLYHRQQFSSMHLSHLFEIHKNRAAEFSLANSGILLDFSKNHITHETLLLLQQLAIACKIPQKIEQLFDASLVNSTENKPALHTALRAGLNSNCFFQDENVSLLIQDNIKKMQAFCLEVHEGQKTGFTGQLFTDVVNIGVGGSDLGAALITSALQTEKNSKLRCHFLATVDSDYLTTLLSNLNPATTLFIVTSKSFRTAETLCNAISIKDWLNQQLQSINAFKAHMVGVSANQEAMLAFGFSHENIFPIWSWVGGRYSIWSSVGLSVALTLGMDVFLDFLAGAREMDNHFQKVPLLKNMPVILALLSVWTINFFDVKSHLIIPYNNRLHMLPSYLQQLAMESTGKNRTHAGDLVGYATGCAVWGSDGCQAQHSFLQLLHQGTQLITTDFIIAMHGNVQHSQQQELLLANCLAQSQALMLGKSAAKIEQELKQQGYSSSQAKHLAQHSELLGNRPSNLLLLRDLSPQTLGALLALYEHKTYVQSAIWDVNPFDQWGIEFGKQLATKLTEQLAVRNIDANLDSSTFLAMESYLKLYPDRDSSDKLRGRSVDASVGLLERS